MPPLPSDSGPLLLSMSPPYTSQNIALSANESYNCTDVQIYPYWSIDVRMHWLDQGWTFLLDANTNTTSHPDEGRMV